MTRAEYDLVRQAARREGVSLAAYLRRCINSALLDAGEAGLLQDRETRGPLSPGERARVRALRARGWTIDRITQALAPRARSTIYRAVQADARPTPEGRCGVSDSGVRESSLRVEGRAS